MKLGLLTVHGHQPERANYVDVTLVNTDHEVIATFRLKLGEWWALRKVARVVELIDEIGRLTR